VITKDPLTGGAYNCSYCANGSDKTPNLAKFFHMVMVPLFIYVMFRGQPTLGSITTHTKNEYSLVPTHSVGEAPDFPISATNSFEPWRRFLYKKNKYIR